MSETLLLPGEELSFQLRRDGYRTLRMIVKTDGSVQVKAPESLPLKAVFSFVHARLDWIRSKQNFFAQHHGSRMELRDGGSVLYLGRAFTIRVIPAARNVRPRLSGSMLELPCRGPAAPEELEKAFRSWRLATARLILSRRLARLEGRARRLLNDRETVSRLYIRSLKRRWGSCSIRGKLLLPPNLFLCRCLL